jgi:hypothetical protein
MKKLALLFLLFPFLAAGCHHGGLRETRYGKAERNTIHFDLD